MGALVLMPMAFGLAVPMALATDWTWSDVWSWHFWGEGAGFAVCHCIATLGCVVPFLVIMLNGFTKGRLVPKSVAEVYVVFFLWNSHLVGYAAFMVHS